MSVTVLFAITLSATASAQTTWVGSTFGGGDLILSDGDTLEGSFVGVGELRVPSGASVFVQPGVPLEVVANTIRIEGTLDGTGSGLPGGNGAPAGGNRGSNGAGQGAGTGGFEGPCVHGGGGGGGGYGGRGGNGSYYFSNGQGLGGMPHGDEADTTDLTPGSGGGGGGSGCNLSGARGGSGGASIHLVAGLLQIDGEIRADGANGANASDSSGGGGGGSGGTLQIDAASIGGAGILSARGGDGGNTAAGVGGLAGGGGGGGGGRIRILYGLLDAALSWDLGAGTRGTDQSQNMALPGTGGLGGTVYLELTDPDPDDDGVEAIDDNCPVDPNPDQLDSDGDGIGDVCDSCPNDPLDSDNDGVCDSEDVCPGHPDALDRDDDGDPDGCDCDSSEPLANSFATEVCDGIDNNCDGLIDEPGTEGELTWFPDLDGDGFGDPSQPRVGCDAPLNHVTDDTDCDDNSPSAHPEGYELCDGLDNDCDGTIDLPSCEDGAAGPSGCGCTTGGDPVGLVWLGLCALWLRPRRR